VDQKQFQKPTKYIYNCCEVLCFKVLVHLDLFVRVKSKIVLSSFEFALKLDARTIIIFFSLKGFLGTA